MLSVRRILAALVIAVWAGSAALAAEQGDALKPGMVLDQSNAQLAEGLLPPEILAHYKDGGYSSAIVDWPLGTFNWPPDFKAATEKNAGQFKLSETGTVVLNSTGEQPPFILGHPFPIIDPADPQAGAKILWNFFYLTWHYGNLHAESQVNWVGPKAIERRTDQDVNFMYYDGVSENDRVPNPQNFSTQQLVVAKTPADLAGTAALSWRYRDPDKRDSAWAFVPALRRVRAVSPANRSDGFLGSDMSQDDGPFFDGKPEDFTWTLKGETDQLRLVDPLNLQGKSNSIWIPGGGWRANWDPALKIIGFQDPDWKGLAWAPRSAALAKRHMYVVEGIPKDKYYLYGKLELYIDKETSQGSWNRKFSWQGELLNTLQVMAYNLKPMTRPDGKVDYIQGSNMSYNVAENIKANRATVAGLKADAKAALDTHHPFEPAFFDMNSLSRFGK
ncbi:MAG TPA: DUF1329 domain-containing protein [Candidatus Dormibacteraeota bacterium]|nr:DUF1329 domain-containing protein [Candidatus Dormibacteraeota bacterium]